MQPRCASCGSGTGVLGDIGQGTAEERMRRRASPGADSSREFIFECLRCGVTTDIRQAERRPECGHCGSRSGVVVHGE
jgi:DNA-directed RNA polymerase subunit RPC12/RpoP